MNDNPTKAAVLGTLKYVTGYDGFEPGAEGNFFPFQLGEKTKGTVMELKKDGQVRYTGLWDEFNVIKVEPGQEWQVVVDDNPVITFDFSKTNFAESE